MHFYILSFPCNRLSMSPFRSLLNYQLLFGLDLLSSIFFPLFWSFISTLVRKKKPSSMIHSNRSSKRLICISFPSFFPVFETKLHGSLPSTGTSSQCQVKGLCGNYWIHKWTIKTSILHQWYRNEPSPDLAPLQKVVWWKYWKCDGKLLHCQGYKYLKKGRLVT